MVAVDRDRQIVRPSRRVIPGHLTSFLRLDSESGGHKGAANNKGLVGVFKMGMFGLRGIICGLYLFNIEVKVMQRSVRMLLKYISCNIVFLSMHQNITI